MTPVGTRGGGSGVERGHKAGNGFEEQNNVSLKWRKKKKQKKKLQFVLNQSDHPVHWSNSWF